MLCQNCGENDANVRYTQIINEVKKEMFLCQDCSKEMGIGNIDLSMPISLSNFFGEFLDEEASLLPNFISPKTLTCKDCGMTYDKFVQTGKFGCKECFDTFSDHIDSILKNIHGGNRHIGRLGKGKISTEKTEIKPEQEISKIQEIKPKNSKLEELQQQMKLAIKEERYEDAAKIRDEIKQIENQE